MPSKDSRLGLKSVLSAPAAGAEGLPGSLAVSGGDDRDPRGLAVPAAAGDHRDARATDSTRTRILGPVMPISENAASQRPALSGPASVARDAARPLADSDSLAPPPPRRPGVVIGRYTLHERIAAGGMASVYLGSLTGAADFSRLVAIKRMHPQFAADETFVARFRNEAWLNARLFHPSIVQTFDVVQWDDELLLVMEYVDGVTLKALCTDASAASEILPLNVTAGILVPVLHGLHAAHEATDDDGRPLRIVHRDFSPHNIIIGRDGHAKVLDFGIAKSHTDQQVTSVGHLTGKFAYLSPEQIQGRSLDRRTDIFAAGIVLWETLAGRRLFRAPDVSEAAIIDRVLNEPVLAPSRFNPAVPKKLDRIVLRALQRDPENRYGSARELALELEGIAPLATPSTIGDCVARLCPSRLEERSRRLAGTRRASLRPPPAAVVEGTEIPTAMLGPVSRVSSLPDEASTPAELEPHRGRWWTRARHWGGAVVFAGVAIALYVYLSRPLSGAGAPVRASTPPAAAPVFVERPEPITLPVAVEQPEDHGVLVESTDGLAAPLSAPNETAIASSRTRDTTPVLPPRGESEGKSVRESPAPRTPVLDCDPPTYLDLDGIRHFKDGCI